jgi:hypothetical protein
MNMNQEHEVNGDGQTMDLSAWETPADQVDTSGPDYSPLPEGTYTLMVSDIKERTSKPKVVDGATIQGKNYHEFTFEVVEGQHQGRKAWLRLFFNSDNDTARSIAQSELACVRLAVGLPRGMPNELIGKVLQAKIGIDRKSVNAQGGPQNRFLDWFDATGASVKRKFGGSTPTPQRGAGAPARPAVPPGQSANLNGRAAPAGGGGGAPGGAPKQFVPPRVGAGGPKPLATAPR